MASTDDLVTVQKNGVVAINALTQALESFLAAYTSFIGDKTYLGITDASLVVQGAGRLVNLMYVDPGSDVGTIHDAATVGEADATNIIVAVPTGGNVGTFPVNIPFTNGLVVKPGTDQVLGVTYS
jgi:hypothetical protein